jgi:hypothetical protein
VDLGVITTPNHAASFSDNANAVYVVDSPPLVAPLVASVPPQILAHALANNLGGSMYGMGEEIHRMDGDPQIYESAIIIE